MNRIITLGAAVLMLMGCVSIGPDYDPAAIDRLQVGMDESQVLALLGQPTSTATLPDGRRQLMWVRARGTALGRADSRVVLLNFDASRKYQGVASQSETHLR